jgi:PPOX class probable F420-dependent enzyme
MPADLKTLEAFLKPSRHAVMITRRKDGRLQTSAVTAVWDPKGGVLVWSIRNRAKHRNLLRDPFATLCVVDGNFRWLHVEGQTEITTQPEALPLLERYWRLREEKEHPNWDEYRKKMVAEDRILFRVQPSHVFRPSE